MHRMTFDAAGFDDAGHGASELDHGTARGRTAARDRRVRRIALAVGAIACLVLPAAGQTVRPPYGQPPAARAGSAEDVTAITVMHDGHERGTSAPFHLVIQFELAPTWHMYWKNPGAGAAPPELDISGPASFEIGEPIWPRPEVISSPVGDMYGYHGRFAIFVPVRPASETVPDSALFQTRLTWAVCDDMRCLLGRSTKTLTVSKPMGLGGDPTVAADRKAVERAAGRLPIQLDRDRPGRERSDHGCSIAWDGDRLRVEVPARGHDSAQFFGNASPGVRYGEPSITVGNDRVVVEVDVTIDRGNTLGKAPRLGGLVGLGTKHDGPSYEFDRLVASMKPDAGGGND